MKPLLAATIKDVDQLQFPVYASAKLDGVRCLIKDGQAVSRSLKPIPNDWVQSVLSNPALEGMDGELIVGSPTHPDCFRTTQSAVMSKEGQPDFTFHVFDLCNRPDLPFHQRLFMLCSDLLNIDSYHITSVGQSDIFDKESLLALETRLLAEGHEGVMVRDPDAMYKYGRSTLKQGILLKLKRVVDNEATIIGYKELQHNENEATTDELGHTKRSSHKAGQVAGGTLGKLIVQDVKTGIQFNIGTGFSAKDRAILWSQRKTGLVGKLVKYKSFAVGVKEAPRFPVFLGFRDKRDLS